MEEEGGARLSKRLSDKGGEVDLRTKAGTAWSHNFLNQKPWHPLSYPNQRRKWIAEQTFAEKERRAQEVSREYAQEQDFFRQTALVSKKEKEKMEMMKAVSFMYIRPPGYNAESAKAAEIADEHNNEDQGESDPSGGASSSKQVDSLPASDEKRKSRPKDVFGRHLPTGEQFEVLKNAPKLETGVHGRAKPFGIEIRNVKCVRCGNFGHQSGDRECTLKDVIMPNEESRLKRDDPLTAILAQTESAEHLKWELKQKPGLSPPRGGFDFDDPNQQIVAEDIFDEYGGFLSGEMPELLANFSTSGNPKKKKTSKRKKKKQLLPSSAQSSSGGEEYASLSDDDQKKSSKKRKHKRQLSSSEESDGEKNRMYSEREKEKRSKKRHKKKSSKYNSDPNTSEDDHDRHKSRHRHDHLGSNGGHKSRHRHHQSSNNDFDQHQKSRSSHHQLSDNVFDHRHLESRSSYHQLSDNDFDRQQKSRSSHRQSSDNDFDRHPKRSRGRRTEADSSDRSDAGERSTHRRHRHRQRVARSSSPDHSDAREHHQHHHRRR